MKIVDLKCSVIECKNIHPYSIIRIDTDEGISGLGPIGTWFRVGTLSDTRSLVQFYKRHILAMDPTNVERVMLRIRGLGGFEPWGKVVSAIEIALWDICGKAVGLPVHRLLGGKIRDKVRVYCGGAGPGLKGCTPEDYAEQARAKKALPEKYSIIKFTIGYHGGMRQAVPNYDYGESVRESQGHSRNRCLTERGLKHTLNCVKAIKEALGDEIGLALDCGPGFSINSALSLAKAVEPLNVIWLEDLITGCGTPYTAVDAYRLVSSNTTTPIHTGEQIYLRHGFKDLIDKNAVDIIGPDVTDVGGIAELKWIAEFADLYGVLVAPHGLANGIIGLAALIQVCATFPSNYIAFELPGIESMWWDLVKGLPRNLVKDSFIEVPERPGLGVELNEEAVRRCLPEKDDFFELKSK